MAWYDDALKFPGPASSLWWAWLDSKGAMRSEWLSCMLPADRHGQPLPGGMCRGFELPGGDLSDPT